MSEQVNEEKTKKCKYCKTDIPADAKICPNCKKKQGGHLKTIIIVAVILIILIAAANGGSDKNKVKDVTATAGKSSSSTTAETSEEDSTETSENEEKNDFAVGEVAEYNDVQISVLDYEESDGNDWGTPESGNKFVFVNIEITNNSDKEISISSMASFEAYCDDYKLDYSSNALMASSTDKRNQLDGSVAAGKKMNGWLGLEVPSDWSNIEIYYKDSIWSDSNFKFTISK